MRNIKTEMGEMIRKRRILLDLLQSDLAAITETSTRTIQLVELGNANPSLDTLLRIIEPLGLMLKMEIKTLSV